jgi:hypothetical protein
MPSAMSKQKTIDEIIKEAKKLDEAELQILLARLRVKKMVKAKANQVAGYDSRKIKKLPTMEEIDAWKHQARKDADK